MVDIESFIPHRKPIRIITEVIDLQDESGVAGMVVRAEWPLSDGESVSSLVLIEAIAQTAALVEGHKRRLEGKDGVKGWLVGIKSADFQEDRISVGTALTVAVKSLYAFDDYAVVAGEVRSGDRVLASAVLQAVRFSDEDITKIMNKE
ncbi:MAG: hypothetical protein R6W75_04070 [Smithellaceae bacterium]